MSDSDPITVPLSEVGSNGRSVGQNQRPEEQGSMNFFANMEALLSRVMATSPPSSTVTNQVNLIQFNPDDDDADIESWCRITEVIVNSKLTGR